MRAGGRTTVQRPENGRFWNFLEALFGAFPLWPLVPIGLLAWGLLILAGPHAK